MANPSSGVTTPPWEGQERTDWKAVVERLKKKPGEWMLIGDEILTSVATYAKRRYGIETRMHGQNPATGRGQLWARWPEATK